MRNGTQNTPPQNFKEAVARFRLPVHGFYVESAEAVLAPYADSKRPEKATELVAKLTQRRAARDKRKARTHPFQSARSNPPGREHAPMAHVIKCRDCFEERTTLYKNTRYCMSCRLLRDLIFLEPTTRKCRSNDCDASFLPVSKKDLFCGECSGELASEHGKCLFCASDDAPLHRGMPICTACVRDPGERSRVIAGLRKGQQTRRARNEEAA